MDTLHKGDNDEDKNNNKFVLIINLLLLLLIFEERKKEGRKIFIYFLRFLECCTALVSLLSQTFRDKPLVPSSRFNLPMKNLCSEFLVLHISLHSVAKHTSKENFEV